MSLTMKTGVRSFMSISYDGSIPFVLHFIGDS